MTEKWALPTPVADVDRAFGPRDLGRYLPSKEEIPEEFWRHRHGMDSWQGIVSTWFFSGLKGHFIWKSGIDGGTAMRHLSAVLGSWEPKHEHKEAGVAYLLSLWAERFEKANGQR